MAIYKEDIIQIDLDGPNIIRSFMNKTIGEGDKEGNRIGFTLMKNGEQVDISANTITGYFIRSDGYTVIIQGTAEGNIAYVTLPQNCYAVEGNFTLAIKISGGGVTGTMRIIDGTVVNTATDSVIDPGGIVPDLDELMAVIERAEDAAEDIAKFAISEELISGNDYRVIIEVEE